MPVELIGRMTERPNSEMARAGPDAPGIDMDWLKKMFQAQERSDFDRVLIGASSSRPDGWAIAQYGAMVTDRLGFLVAHRPGFVAPTYAARKGATIDHFTNGRLAIHIITGSDGDDLQRDGDAPMAKSDRYARSDEFLDIMKLTWTSDQPFDYTGKHYAVSSGFASLKPLQEPHVPIYFAGSSPEALIVAGKHAHTWAMWSVPVAGVEQQIDALHAAAAPFGRKPGVSVSFRPIMASTEEKAWERARQILEAIRQVRGGEPKAVARSIHTQHQVEWAEKAEIHDQRLWTGLTQVLGPATNNTALVGTPDQVVESLLAYYDAGVTTILIHGFNQYEDAVDFGRDLIPTLRAEVRLRDMRVANAAAVDDAARRLESPSAAS